MTQRPSDGAADLAPVVDDMSIYLIPGRVKAAPELSRGYFHVGQVYQEGVDAERLGFRRAFLSERHSLKDAGAILGGVAARTTRLGLGTGATSAPARHPQVLAGFGSTMQALNGPRLVLGLGRGDAKWMGQLSFEGFTDYAKLLRRFWAGETVDYDGPAGRVTGMMDDLLGDIPQPEIWYFGLTGGPKMAAAVADPVWDGVTMIPFLTPDAVHDAVQRIRQECERAGRDPDTLRIAHCIVTAPDMDDFDARAICQGRLVTYLMWSGLTEPLAKANGWDMDVIHKVREHVYSLGRGQDLPADQLFHRAELVESGTLIPDAWVEDVCGVGSAEECAKNIRRYREAGANETLLYGSSPAQNAGLIAAWREQSR